MNSLLECLNKKLPKVTPIWFMRQAGRYLPEFRKIRSKNTNFINLCLDVDLSSEITIQPIKRFDLDAAIIFSDILLVPYAMNQEVKFKEDIGPVLSDFSLKKFDIIKTIDFKNKLSPVYKSLTKTRKNLNSEKSLIAFSGAPWTLLVYMLDLKSPENKLKETFFSKKKLLNQTINKLTEFICLHLDNQVNAGADVIQIFDSWAGLIPNENLDEYCIKPNMKIVNYFKEKGIPVICFPKGLKNNYKKFNDVVSPDGLNIDYEIDPIWARENLFNTCLQGGMHPKILLGDKKVIINEVEKYMKTFKQQPYIFNLGHGILPQTNPEVLENIIKKVKSFNDR